MFVRYDLISSVFQRDSTVVDVGREIGALGAEQSAVVVAVVTGRRGGSQPPNHDYPIFCSRIFE